jgi:ferredoxin--NADP+ reductase
MLEDVGTGHTLEPSEPDPAAAERLVRQRQPDYVSYADWLRLNELEIARGSVRRCPRLKFTRVDEMLAALGNRTRP